VNKVNKLNAKYLKIPKKHREPHKTPSWATCLRAWFSYTVGAETQVNKLLNCVRIAYDHKTAMPNPRPVSRMLPSRMFCATQF